MTKRDEDDPALAAFHTCENLRGALHGIGGWDVSLALIMTLAEVIVFGNFPEDDHDAGLRLARCKRALGDIANDLIRDGPGDPDEDPRPSPSAPDLLRNLLERRRAAKKGNEP